MTALFMRERVRSGMGCELMSVTILIVDDEVHVIHVLKRKFESCGFTVVTGRSGKEGFNLAREHQPALILTDFQMPQGSGLDMAMRLKESSDTADIPLIMLTARGHKISAAELARTNIRLLKDKPFSARELVKHVQEELAGSAATEGMRHG